MRDPGRPRRNPFFEHDSDGATDDAGMGWRDDHAATASDPVGEPGPDGRPEDPPIAAGGFATLLALVEGLADAQPEAAEHLVAAAHEVVLTVKVLVDATEAVLAEQRAALVARAATPSPDAASPADETVAGAEVATPVVDLSVVRSVEVP
ncbi:MAG: hypothetical protein ACXVJF_01570 [Acidimicrobiia bacterium]